MLDVLYTQKVRGTGHGPPTRCRLGQGASICAKYVPKHLKTMMSAQVRVYSRPVCKPLSCTSMLAAERTVLCSSGESPNARKGAHNGNVRTIGNLEAIR